jgi:hypothetical protein
MVDPLSSPELVFPVPSGVFGVQMRWTGLQADYDLRLARSQREEQIERSSANQRFKNWLEDHAIPAWNKSNERGCTRGYG